MTDQFQYYEKTITLSTAVSAEGIDWWVEVPQDNGTVIRYCLSYPQILGGAIVVRYTPQVRFQGEVIQSLPQEVYYESNLLGFYNQQVNQAYGEFAAQQAINGLVARLKSLGGDKQRPQLGHRVYVNGQVVQPVVFELVDIQADTGASDGGFRVNIINGTAPYKWKLADDSHWRTADDTYNDLSEGVYEVQVEDAAGDTRSEKVYVPAGSQ